MAVGVGACNALNGTSDLDIGAILAGGPLADGGRGADGTTGGGGDGDGGGGPGDGTDGGDTMTDGGDGFIADAGVNPKVSSCGKNLVCLPNVGGWSPAVFLFNAGAGAVCPTDYPQKTDLRMSGGGGCNCACTPTGGSCDGDVSYKTGVAACAGPGTPLKLVTSGAGTCSATPAFIPLPYELDALPNGLPPKSCGGTVNPNLNPPRPASYCTGAAPVASSMCGSGEICVKQGGFQFGGGLACIVHDGDIACPNRLSFRTLVGSAVTDGRSCGNTCACSVQPCGGSLQAFSDPGCVTATNQSKVDGMCVTAGADMTGASYRYTPSSGCGVSASAKVIGSETYTAPRTLCCSFGG